MNDSDIAAIAIARKKLQSRWGRWVTWTKYDDSFFPIHLYLDFPNGYTASVIYDSFRYNKAFEIGILKDGELIGGTPLHKKYAYGDEVFQGLDVWEVEKLIDMIRDLPAPSRKEKCKNILKNIWTLLTRKDDAYVYHEN